MGIFRRRPGFGDTGAGDIERELRSARPRPDDEFLAAMLHRVEADAPQAPAGRARARWATRNVVVAVALTVALLVPVTALGGFTVASTAVKNVASSTSGSVSKLVSKPKAKAKAKKKAKSALIARRAKAKAAKRYLAQVSVDLYTGDDSNWPYKDTNGDPLTQNVYKLYVCHLKNNSTWKVVGLKYDKWTDNVANHSSHGLDQGYFTSAPTPAQCGPPPS